MRTIRTKVYKFDELSTDGQQKAIDKFRNKYSSNDTGIYSDEIVESVKAFADLFNLKIGREYSDLRTGSIDDNILQLSNVRLYKWLINNYSSYWTNANYISKHKDGKFKNSYFYYKYDCVKYRKSRITVTNNLENCPLTGVCYDTDIMQPIIDFLKKPYNCTFEDLLNDVESAISKTFNDVEKWVNSDEFIKNSITSNEDEFTQDGRMI